MNGGSWAGWRLVARIVAFIVGYILLLVLAYQIAYAPSRTSANWWPPMGLAIGVLTRAPRRAWAPLLLSLAVVAFAIWLLGFPAVRRPPLIVAGLLSVSVAVPPLVGAWVLRRIVGRPFLLQRSRNVALFVLFGAFLPAMVDTGINALAWAVWPGANRPPFEVAFWWSSGMTGAISIAPLVLTLPVSGHVGRLLLRRVPEAAILLVGILLAAWAIFHLPTQGLQVIALAGATFPLLGWAALRFGPTGGALAAFLLTSLATWQTFLGYGPFGDPGAHPTWLRISYVQAFFAFATVSTLVMAAVASERRLATIRQRLLLETGLVLGRSLPMQKRLQQVADMVVSALALRCEIRIGTTEVVSAANDKWKLAETRVSPIKGSEGEEWLGELRIWHRPEHRDFGEEEGQAASIMAASIGAVEERETLQRGLASEMRIKDESLAYLDAVVGGSPMGIAIFDTNLRYVRINESLAKLNQHPVAEHVGHTAKEMIPVLGQQIERELRNVLLSGEPNDSEYSLPDPAHPGQNFTWFCLWFPIQAPDQGPIGVGAFVMDITEQQREREALARSEERFRSLAEASAKVVWAMGQDGLPRFGAEAWSAFTGQQMSSFHSRTWMEPIHPEDRERAFEEMRLGIQGEQPYTIEYRLRRRDGVYRHMEVRTVPIRNKQGQLIEWVGMSVDVTDRIEAEEERARLFIEAQEAIRLRDDFLTIASHELKTPLTPLSARLQGMQKMAAKGIAIDPEQIAKTRASLDRLTFLINDLLDVSRIRQARLGFHTMPFALGEVVTRVVETYREHSEIHRIDFELPPFEVIVSGDRKRIEQVVLSLVDNAFKYSPAGGVIGVRLRVENEGAILCVSDQGIGIPEEEQARLFDRFFRARNSVVTSYGGLGLGLYISRDIVEHHGGRIWVESVPGEGSTFCISLPLLPAGEAALPA